MEELWEESDIREAGPGPQRRRALGGADHVMSEKAGLRRGWRGHLRGGGPGAGLSRLCQRRQSRGGAGRPPQRRRALGGWLYGVSTWEVGPVEACSGKARDRRGARARR